MYEAVWKLTQPAFRNAPDPTFYFAAPTHEEILARLRYALAQAKPLLPVIGPSGTGKTFLLHVLHAEQRKAGAPSCVVKTLYADPLDLLREILAGFGLGDRPGTSLRDNLRALEEFTVTRQLQGQRALLQIDEAHRIQRPEVLELLRQLTNFETDRGPAMSILLWGQPGLGSRWYTRVPLSDRVDFVAQLHPLKATESQDYILHRLKVAGSPQNPFESDALAHLAAVAAGLPRRLNTVADLSLLLAASARAPRVGRAHVTQAAEEARPSALGGVPAGVR